jgi:hypothetical protein
VAGKLRLFRPQSGMSLHLLLTYILEQRRDLVVFKSKVGGKLVLLTE